MLGSIGTDIQNIANKVKTSIESKLSKTFKTFDVVKSDPPYDPQHSSYRMEVLTDDNNVVRVKTVRKESGQEWESYVEQYDQNGSVTGIGGGPNSASALTDKGKISKGLADLASKIRKDIETSLNKTFQTYNVVSSTPEYAPEHASYRMELQTDNDGIVTVRTVKKENGQEWETSVESYDQGKKVEGGAQGSQAGQGVQYSADQLAESMKNLHLKVRGDVEKSLNKQFKNFNVVKHDPPFHPEHTSYRLEVETEDNGNVKVTTVKKEDGHEWTTSVAEYDHGQLVSGSQAAQ